MIFFYAENFFFGSEELKKFFFSRELNTFFPSSTSSFRFVHEHTDGALYTTTIIWSSSSFFLSLLLLLRHTLAYIRSHTRSYIQFICRAYILYNACVYMCIAVRARVWVCTTCLRETSVHCSVFDSQPYVFFSSSVHRKMPPDGVLNVKCVSDIGLLRMYACTYMCVCMYCSINASRIWWHFLNRWFSDFKFLACGENFLNFFRFKTINAWFLWFALDLPTNLHVYFVKYWQLWFFPAAWFYCVCRFFFESTYRLDILLMYKIYRARVRQSQQHAAQFSRSMFTILVSFLFSNFFIRYWLFEFR